MSIDRARRAGRGAWTTAVVRAGLLLGVAFLLLGPGEGPLEVWGQGSGPLAQYAQNVRQWHIVARYYSTVGTTRVQVNFIQTVTGTAVKGTSSAGFWLIEQHHINPEFFYSSEEPPNVPSGTPITFHYFIDRLDVNALARGTGVPVKVLRRTPTYAVLQEQRRRLVRAIPIATDVEVGESVVVAVLVEPDLTRPGRFEERTARVTSVQQGFFTIDVDLDAIVGNSAVHGAPVFVRRGGQWQLAGIFVSHGLNPRAGEGESAIARLPSLNKLIPEGADKSDRDGDGVPDDEDRCPTVPGDPGNSGCPAT